MTDQFTYLNDRLKHLESRVNMLESGARAQSGEDDQGSASPRRGQPESSSADSVLSTIQSLTWTIYEFVTSDATGRHNEVADLLDIKSNQYSAGRRLESIEQAVSEVRGGVETIVGLLSKQS
jgi:hypothetical protein